MSPALSVVVPTLNPPPERLRRVLHALATQTLSPGYWELLLVDNGSTLPLGPGALPAALHARARIVREETTGLAFARRRGFREAAGDLIVLVDDDNVLAPDYLEQVVAIFHVHPRLGAAGGRIVPEFEQAPPAWVREFDGLLACRDLGRDVLISSGLRPAGASSNVYPIFAPVGAGMALRRAALQRWVEGTGPMLPDRQGNALTSSGDNEIVFSVLQASWEVGYFPTLALAHVIPPSRTTPEYLARLNEAIAASWIQVLRRHDACPWPPIAAWTVPLRQAKAWFKHRAWSGPAPYIRWRGACGHFAGLAARIPHP